MNLTRAAGRVPFVRFKTILTDFIPESHQSLYQRNQKKKEQVKILLMSPVYLL